MIKINLTQGLSDNDQYKAFKFPGGEIHFKMSKESILAFTAETTDHVHIKTRLNSSDDIMLLAIVVDTIKKDWPNKQIFAQIPYFPYMQADRDFAIGESFSLTTLVRMLTALPIEGYSTYDTHSDVLGALIRGAQKRIVSVDNSAFIEDVMLQLPKPLTIISPDAGAYKKIFKLADKIKFKGSIECANKYRDTNTGELGIRISKDNFNGDNVLIIDDICIGGRTFIELAQELQKRNVGAMYLAVSHGIFSNGYDELSKYFSGIFTTNSRQEFKTKPEFLNVKTII